jgi:hypothetical protein
MTVLMRTTGRARVGLLREVVLGRVRTLVLPGRPVMYALEDGMAVVEQDGGIIIPKSGRPLGKRNKQTLASAAK